MIVGIKMQIKMCQNGSTRYLGGEMLSNIKSHHFHLKAHDTSHNKYWILCEDLTNILWAFIDAEDIRGISFSICFTDGETEV